MERERKSRGREKKGKETLITETLTHKKGEADTSGNQRNVSQLGDTSIHPALSAVFLLKAMSELDWGGGRVGKRKKKPPKQKTKLKDELKPAVLKPCGREIGSRQQPGRTSLSLGQERLRFQAFLLHFHTPERHAALVQIGRGLFNHPTGQLVGRLGHTV